MQFEWITTSMLNNSMFARYLFSDYNTLQGDPLNARPQVFPDQPPLGEVFRRTSNLAVSYRRVFSPRVVNELTFGYARFGFLFTQGEANPKMAGCAAFRFFQLKRGLYQYAAHGPMGNYTPASGQFEFGEGCACFSFRSKRAFLSPRRSAWTARAAST
jgi:hypothetical protein